MGRRGSFAEAVALRRRVMRRIFLVLALFLAFDSFRTTFLASYAVRSVSMLPAFAPGDRFISTALPFGPKTAFGKLPALSGPRRGAIVLASLPGSPREGFWASILDSFVRLLSFQRLSTLHSASDNSFGALILKRVIAIPGDTVLMEGGRYRIKTPESDIFRGEKEISERSYEVGTETILPEGIDGLPGSGHMDARTLRDNEYFLAGDNRSESSDSRILGPFESGSIVGLVLFRFWPPSRIGVP